MTELTAVQIYKRLNIRVLKQNIIDKQSEKEHFTLIPKWRHSCHCSLLFDVLSKLLTCKHDSGSFETKQIE